MTPLRGISAAIVLFCAATLSADDPAADSTDSWLSHLASDSFIQRDFASRQLLTAGESVVPRLVEVAEGNDRTAALTAVTALGQMTGGIDDPATTAHRALAQLAARPESQIDSVREPTVTARRRADRRIVGIVRAHGGIVTWDESLQIIGLQIQNKEFNDRHARTLSRLIHLKSLDLRKSAITNVSLEALVALDSLENLNLSDTQVTASGVRHLAPLHGLRKLTLYRIALSAGDVEWLEGQFADCELLH